MLKSLSILKSVAIIGCSPMNVSALTASISVSNRPKTLLVVTDREPVKLNELTLKDYSFVREKMPFLDLTNTSNRFSPRKRKW